MQRDVPHAVGVVDDDTVGMTPFIAALPAPPPPRVVPLAARQVPDVHGLTVRQAVHTLHVAGFRVQLAAGQAGATVPAVGTVAPAGAIVRLMGTP